MAKHNYQEKRDFGRMHIETQVTYTVNDDNDKSYHATSQNLSATGICMMTERALVLGNKVNIIMNAGNDRLQPFVADGEVLRCKHNKRKPDVFQVSLKFVQPNNI